MYDADRIAGRIKADLQLPQNRIELSFASDNIQAVAQEIEALYAYMDYISDQHFLDTAEGDGLDRNGLLYGVSRKLATFASGEVTFEGEIGTWIERDTRVRTKDGRSFVTLEGGRIEAAGSVTVPARAEAAGKAGNVPAHAIYAADPSIVGVRRVYNAKPFTFGAERESDDAYRERLYLKIRTPATSGNKYHYLNWALAVEGVGRAKVFPLWNGPGTVKVSIIDTDMKPASAELVEKVRTIIDPDPGMGEGKAPIGAHLTVTTAKEKNIDVKATVTKKAGADLKGITAEAKKALAEHFRATAYTDARTLSYAMVVSMIYALSGVADVKELTLNGDTKTIEAGEEELFAVGEVVIDDAR